MLNLNPEQIDVVSKDKQYITLNVIHEMCLRDKSKIDFMSFLKSHGIKIGCVTNSIKKTTIAMLSNSGIIDFIDKIITNEDVGVPKPDPEGYIKCMESFSALPQETIIVEDSEKGVMAASKTNSHIWVVKNAKSVTVDDFNMFCSFNSFEIGKK
jgi:beta-phosphoglucomutase-like phosphatase (HAD superfamily)